ncbi:MAG: GAK system ATP-grasp enzyme [Phycisphaerae bacterium]|nr:GAK system ATP-grasp enzyme [Phycisphaerales bacterium]
MTRIGVVGVPEGWSSLRLVDAVKSKTDFGLLIDMEHVVVDLDAGTAMFGDVDLCTLDAMIIKKVGVTYSPDLMARLAMLRYIGGRGPKIFSPPANIKRVIDRLSCTVSLRAADIPMPTTVITEDLEQAASAVKRLGKCILKPLYSTKARGMIVVEPGPDLMEDLQTFKANGNVILYLQQMIDLPGKDLGLAFLGGEFCGCYARVRSAGEWNTTTHSGGKYKAHEASPDIIELARRAQKPFGLDFTCVDVAETADGPVVFEVSAFGGFRGLLEANNFDAADHYAQYVLNQLKAQ